MRLGDLLECFRDESCKTLAARVLAPISCLLPAWLAPSGAFGPRLARARALTVARRLPLSSFRRLGGR